jgi:hypothetical protein
MDEVWGKEKKFIRRIKRRDGWAQWTSSAEEKGDHECRVVHRSH